jgi:phage gpG-like protein
MGGGMNIKLVGDWKLAAKILNAAPGDIEKAIEQAVRLEALVLEGAIKRNIQRGPPPPLSPLTRKTRKGAKGGSKPLNATGGLLGAVTVVQKGDEAFIGIPRSAGKYNLAVTHEQGRTIVLNMTDKMRRFLFGVLFKGSPPKAGPGTRIIVIRIPARPFVQPAFAAEAPKSQQRFQEHLAKLLGGSLGS